MGTFGLKIDSILLMDPKVSHWISVVTWKEKEKGKMRVCQSFCTRTQRNEKAESRQEKIIVSYLYTFCGREFLCTWRLDNFDPFVFPELQ